MISCNTSAKEQVLIEVQENGSFKIGGSKVFVGALDWHFPKRSWDARLQVTTSKILTGSYLRNVENIVKTFRVSASSDETVDVVMQNIDQELQIQSVVLYRSTTHRATIYPDLLLHLTETQDLGIWQPTGSDGCYYGSIKTPVQMIDANRLWWEASISSTRAAQILQENETLELGEVARWIPSAITSKGVIRDFSSLAEDIITRIDHIGVNNKGPRNPSGSKTTKTSEKAIDSSSFTTTSEGYW